MIFNILTEFSDHKNLDLYGILNDSDLVLRSRACFTNLKFRSIVMQNFFLLWHSKNYMYIHCLLKYMYTLYKKILPQRKPSNVSRLRTCFEIVQKNLSLTIRWCTVKKHIPNWLLASPTIRKFLWFTYFSMPTELLK